MNGDERLARVPVSLISLAWLSTRFYRHGFVLPM